MIHEGAMSNPNSIGKVLIAIRAYKRKLDEIRAARKVGCLEHRRLEVIDHLYPERPLVITLFLSKCGVPPRRLHGGGFGNSSLQ